MTQHRQVTVPSQLVQPQLEEPPPTPPRRRHAEAVDGAGRLLVWNDTARRWEPLEDEEAPGCA